MIQFDFSGTDALLEADQLEGALRRAQGAQQALIAGSGAGAQWLGWRSLLDEPDTEGLDAILNCATEIRERADVLLCVGIGGSYLGAEAVLEALAPANGPRILFAGHHLSGSYLKNLLQSLDGKSVCVNAISKSGTTLEPALAFRVIREWMERNHDDSDARIFVTTDVSQGALRSMATQRGWRAFPIPENVGGRFSVLTAVGLLPIAAAGIDPKELLRGATSMKQALDDDPDNPAVEYAARRYLLHEQGFAIEQLSVFEPRLAGIGNWWRQLFGESEGKQGKGLYPAVCSFTTDLHSMGQMIQDGRRNVLETFLHVDDEGEWPEDELRIPSMTSDIDGLGRLEGRLFSEVNQAAFTGTIRAHALGGVPVIALTLPSLTATNLGRLIYFFEHAVSLGGYLLGVNPFDQPGVESYKRHMREALDTGVE